MGRPGSVACSFDRVLQKNNSPVDRHQYLVGGLKILDLVIMAACFAVAAVLITPGLDVATIREFMGLRFSLGNSVLFIGFIALWHLLFSAFGLYGDSLLWNGYHLSCGSKWRYG